MTWLYSTIGKTQNVVWNSGLHCLAPLNFLCSNQRNNTLNIWWLIVNYHVIFCVYDLTSSDWQGWMMLCQSNWDSWTVTSVAYLEEVKLFFTVNDIAEICGSLLLSSVGGNTYSLLLMLALGHWRNHSLPCHYFAEWNETDRNILWHFFPEQNDLSTLNITLSTNVVFVSYL